MLALSLCDVVTRQTPMDLSIAKARHEDSRQLQQEEIKNTAVNRFADFLPHGWSHIYFLKEHISF